MNTPPREMFGWQPEPDLRMSTGQKLAATFAVLLAIAGGLAALWFALGGFGVAGSQADETRANDRADVAYAEEGLWSAVETRTGSRDLVGETQQVVRALKRARSDGVSRVWIDMAVSDAESDVSYASGGCGRCSTILENAR